MQRIAWLEMWLAAAALWTLAIAVFVGVVFRYVLRLPLSWTGELANLAFAWLVFLGAAACTAQGAHLSVDVLPARFKERYGRTAARGVALVTGLTALALAYLGIVYAVKSRGQVTSILQLSLLSYTLSLPVGMCLGALHALFGQGKAGGAP